MNTPQSLRRRASLTRQSVFVSDASTFGMTLLVAFLVAVSSGVSISAQEPAAPAGAQSPAEAPAKRRTSQTPRAGKAERAAPEPRGAAGAITGRVVADDGHPMANVSVTFSKRGNAGMVGGVGAATDAEGKFSAENLDPGFYVAGVYIPGYTRVTEPGVERDEPRYHRPGENVTITVTKGGVITGTVRNANGDPVVGAFVRAVLVRQPDGRTSRNATPFFYGPPRMSDDRGIYRIYGLEPGSYVISVGGGGSDQFGGAFSPFAGEAPTYHPSATRDGAVEVVVQAGQEASGIDVRHRGERGRTVSGKVSGLPESDSDFNYGVSVSLTHAVSGLSESFANLSGRAGDRSFSLDGVADGEYEVTARRWSRQGQTMASEPQRITVRGTDVTGLNLTLAPHASISGRVTLAAMPEAERGANACADAAPRVVSPPESLIIARREEKDSGTAPPLSSRRPSRFDAAPDAQGEFTLQSLDAGRYRLEAIPPGDDWYVRTVNVSGATAAAQPPPQGSRRGAAAQSINNVVRDPSLTLASGQKVSGVTVAFADGAASLRGTIPPDEAAQQSARRRVHVIPSERERADDPFRYASSPVAADGSFALMNLAPGRYWLLVAVAADDAPPARQRAGAFDADTRAKLRRDAETAANTIDLQPCQRVNDFTLKK